MLQRAPKMTEISTWKGPSTLGNSRPAGVHAVGEFDASGRQWQGIMLPVA